MAYRHIMITNSINLRAANNMLIIDNIHSVPIEDIDSILIENHKANISAYLMGKLADDGVCVFFCDAKHMPNAVLTPLNCHSRKTKILRAQINIKTPVLKKLWKEIIKAKIENSAKVLEILGIESNLLDISKKVLSGDSTNMEAVAAAKYFKELFGGEFTRRSDTCINACLNYGYAILRGLIARTLVVYGFEPSIGIFHHSELNSFNLADDIIEVYRPVVDLYVAMNLENLEGELTPDIKQGLYNVLNLNVFSDGEKHTVSYAIERTIKSLSSIFIKSADTKLKLCKIMNLEIHEYE